VLQINFEKAYSASFFKIYLVFKKAQSAVMIKAGIKQSIKSKAGRYR